MHGHQDGSGFQFFSVFTQVWMLIEQLGDNQLFRWLIGHAPVEPFWPAYTFIRTRGRLLNEELMAKSLELLLASPAVHPPRRSAPHSGGLLGRPALRQGQA
jgi:hypothetical protein